jgi:hypothetical protein
VIELDDRSHRSQSRQRQDQDAWKDEVLHAAQLPIYRIRAQPAYDVIELTKEIDRMIGESCA